MPRYPIKSPEVKAVYDLFPEDIRSALMKLRRLIFTVGNRIDRIGSVEETIKWGEPSYSTISGSPVRLGWKKNDPEKIALYFHCQTSLVSTFRKLYPKTFSFEGNRAIVFQKKDRIPEEELKQCIELALSYHRRKNKPLLGAENIKVNKQAAHATSTAAP